MHVSTVHISLISHAILVINLAYLRLDFCDAFRSGQALQARHSCIDVDVLGYSQEHQPAPETGAQGPHGRYTYDEVRLGVLNGIDESRYR